MRCLQWLFLVMLTGCASTMDLQAHRGGRGVLPENTLAAFEYALDRGVTTLELDTAVTKDGVVVISHDTTLNHEIVRGPDGQWLAKKGPPIYSMTFSELQQYDVGRLKPNSEYEKRFPHQSPRDGTRMPTLASLFELIRKRGDTKTHLSIETKLSPFEREETLAPEPFVDAVLAVIRRYQFERRVSIISFDWRTLKLVQQKAPDMPTVYLSVQQKFFDNIRADAREGSGWTAGLNAMEFGGSVPDMIKAANGTIWSAYHRDLNEKKLQRARALGLKVTAWTVNETADIERAVKLGVDSIVTDYPERVETVLAQQGMRVR